MPLSHTPAFNLKAVLNETGIAADTLRSWERRYGIPKPQRTPGGHRLYSQHDIHLIRWLMARQAEGLSISRAAGLWNELSASGADPLEEAAASEGRIPQDAPAASLDSLRFEWLAACVRFDERAADQVLNQAFALYPVENVVHALIQAGLSEMGTLWMRGEVSVQQEHFAAGLATRRLDALLSAAPAPFRREAVLLACPPEEWHAFPLLVLSLILRRRGWNTINLGANVPQQQLDETVRAIQPDVVVLAAQGLPGAASLMHAAALIAQNGVPVAFGGRVFNRTPELRQQITGGFIGETLEQAPGRIAELLERGAQSTSSVLPIRSSLAREYRLKRPLIEAALRGALDQFGAPEEMEPAGFHFGRTLAAALDLGEVGYIQADLDWIRSMSRRGARPAEALPAYISAYSQALRAIMGASGEPIADWLDRYASRA